MVSGAGFDIRTSTNLPIPDWATYTPGLLLVLLIQIASTSFSLVFLLINTRLNMTFVVARAYRIFGEGVETLWSQAEAEARWMVAN
jgi:hypothetical protein